MVTTKASQVQKEEKEKMSLKQNVEIIGLLQILLHKEECSVNNKLLSRNTRRSLKININNIQANNNANRKKEKRKNVLGMECVKHLTIAKITVALRNMTTNLFKTQKTKVIILLRTKLVMSLRRR
jgi:hypothetical protein